jgi:uncharacterized repeat protein (TIGR03803 family)
MTKKPCDKCLLVSAVILSIWAGSAVAQASGTESTIHTFHGGDGMHPQAGLIADSSGNLYGTTLGGGNGQCSCGTIFKVTPERRETVLHSFKGGSDGAGPYGGLVFDGAGNLYGTTAAGGSSGCNGHGCGTVFKLSGTKESVLYAFQGGSDGWEPEGALVIDGNGNLYGTTAQGGSYTGTACAKVGCGTVFELESGATMKTLYGFLAQNDGSNPVAGVILDNSGNLFGTTYSGGGSGCNSNGCGTVFKISSDDRESVQYAFQGGSDGSGPWGGVIIDDSGNLYGTTGSGGSSSCPGSSACGTVFKVTSDGTETVLYNFQGGTDGWLPHSSLIMDGTGNLYGTTYFGGGMGCQYKKHGAGCGTVFELAPDGTESVLYTFRRRHGEHPFGGLLLGTNGELYGTTSEGGKHNDGVVFELAQ